MTNAPLDRQTAANRTRIAQMAAALVIAAGIAIVVFGVPGVKLPAVVTPGPIADVDLKPVADTADAKPKVNFGAVADRFSLVSNRPVTPVEAPPPVPVAEVKPEPPPAPPTEDAKFLGIVAMGSTKMALIAKADKQFFVGVGGKVGDQTVEEISEHAVRMSGTPSTLELTPKGTEVVTHAGAAGGGANPFAAGGARPHPNMLNAQNNKNNPNAAILNAQAAARAARGGSGRAMPNVPPSMPASLSVPTSYAHIFNDPAKRARFEQLQAKFRGSNEYAGEAEINEAAAKFTDQEYTIPKKGEK